MQWFAVKSETQYFNSQPRKEADRMLPYLWKRYWYFNSQPRKEADILTSDISKKIYTFQFTASQGGWRQMETWSTGMSRTISIHSLARRLTISILGSIHGRCISIHSLARRLTFTLVYFTIGVFYFNSQPRKEADGREWASGDRSGISIHSLARRLTGNVCVVIIEGIVFQFTASQGGWLLARQN